MSIIEVSKIWRLYLKGCQHEVLAFTNYNYLYQLMDKRVWALIWSIGLKSPRAFLFTTFQIDYYHSKANKATNALSRFSQRIKPRKTSYKIKNSDFHKLQSSLTYTGLYLSVERHNIEAYVKDYDVCLTLKADYYKLYKDL